jgi:hypothetical protein
VTRPLEQEYLAARRKAYREPQLVLGPREPMVPILSQVKAGRDRPQLCAKDSSAMSTALETAPCPARTCREVPVRQAGATGFDGALSIVAGNDWR